jgi:hypothetical protein
VSFVPSRFNLLRQLTVITGVLFPQSDPTKLYVPTGVDPVVLYPYHIVCVGFVRLVHAMYNSHLHGVTFGRKSICVYVTSRIAPLILNGSKFALIAHQMHPPPAWYNVPSHGGSLLLSHSAQAVKAPNPLTLYVTDKPVGHPQTQGAGPPPPLPAPHPVAR